MRASNVVSVFGSSKPEEGTPEFALAFEVGAALGKQGFTVCNGGYGGTMLASAKGARQAGSRTIGVTSSYFSRTVNPWIQEEIRVGSFVERLLKLIELGDAYVVLKGGTGTLLELAAAWEMINKQVIGKKPIVIIGSFWNGVVETLREELLWEGMGDCTQYIKAVDSAEACAAYLAEKLR